MATNLIRILEVEKQSRRICNKPTSAPTLKPSSPNKNPSCRRLTAYIWTTICPLMPPSWIIYFPDRGQQQEKSTKANYEKCSFVSRASPSQWKMVLSNTSNFLTTKRKPHLKSSQKEEYWKFQCPSFEQECSRRYHTKWYILMRTVKSMRI